MDDIKINYDGEELVFSKEEEEVNDEMLKDLKDTLELKDSLIIAREKLVNTIVTSEDDFYG